MVFKHFDSDENHVTTECVPGSLRNVEQLALSAARAEDDDNSETPFDLAQYLSIVSVARDEAPCFAVGVQEAEVARDAEGYLAPQDMIEAENLLKQAEEKSWEGSRHQKAKARAIRLLEHANFLASDVQLDAAAEWRYRTSSDLAASWNEKALASEALGRLGVMFLQRSRRKEALTAAEEALQHDSDPLALYLQASLQLSFGHLPTGSDVQEAAQRLKSLAGKLPWEALEKERSALETDLATWEAVAEGDTMKCFGLADVAKVLICLVSRFAF